MGFAFTLQSVCKHNVINLIESKLKLSLAKRILYCYFELIEREPFCMNQLACIFAK